MKPSWDQAPKWANWLAQDADGSWWWYKEEPYESSTIWQSSFRSQRATDATKTALGPKESKP